MPHDPLLALLVALVLAAAVLYLLNSLAGLFGHVGAGRAPPPEAWILAAGGGLKLVLS
jgi:hypothetical protein